MGMVQAECTTSLEDTPTDAQRVEMFIRGGVQESSEAESAVLLP